METKNKLSEGILALPERSADYTEWANAALEAEKREAWEEAQALWEYALIDSLKDCDPAETGEEAILKNGTGFVILTHLIHLIDDHFYMNWSQRDKVKPTGH